MFSKGTGKMHITKLYLVGHTNVAVYTDPQVAMAQVHQNIV